MSKIEPLYENILASFVITSDNHMDVKHPVPKVPMKYLCQSLFDAQNAEFPTDAYITVGDTTSRGNEVNWSLARKCFAKYTPAKQIFLTIGNHDTWNDDGFGAALDEYLKSATEICKSKQEKTYFSAEIKGCKLIFIGSAEDNGCAATLGETQLEWFKNEMASAQAGKPIFVFCHQSLNGRHGLPRTWDKEEKPDRAPDEGGLGKESELVAKILKSRDNVYYFSGHSHMGLCGEKTKKNEGYSTFETEDGVVLINLPSLACHNHHGELNGQGLGLVLEVYPDRVVIRPRSFSRHKMIKGVKIKDGKPYFEKQLI